MANDLNDCKFIGRLGSDPEMKYLPDGTAKATFNIAVGRKYKDQEYTQWPHIVAWGKLAELCGQYLTKGRQVCVTAEFREEKWDDRETGQKRSRPTFVASRIQFLGSGGDSQGGGQGGAPGYENDDIPF